MLHKICIWLAHSENKVAPAISLKEMFGSNFDYLAENYLDSLDDFAQRIVLADSTYEQTSIEKNSIFFIESDTLEPREFKTSEARLWKFNEQNFIAKIAQLLKLDSTALRLENFTDGYCLGTTILDHKYAIFLCFNENNFPLSAYEYLKDGVRPILIRTRNIPISGTIKKFILEHNGIECHISDLFNLSSAKGLTGGDLKSLLSFRGTRQKQTFNLADIKKSMENKHISDLKITIIERYKINFSVRDTPFSLTLNHSDIPDFYNSRLKTAKECWETLCYFSASKNEHRLLYTATLKNRLSELRKFFKKIKDVEAFENFQDEKKDSKHKSRGVMETFTKPLFRIKAVDNEYDFTMSGKY